MEESLFDCLILNPLKAMKKSLNCSSTISTRTYGDAQDVLRFDCIFIIFVFK